MANFSNLTSISLNIMTKAFPHSVSDNSSFWSAIETLYSFLKIFLIEVQLIYNAVPISALQQSNSAIHT